MSEVPLYLVPTKLDTKLPDPVPIQGHLAHTTPPPLPRTTIGP